jgi:hypothetical protein
MKLNRRTETQILPKIFQVIYEQRERVFHRDIQTRENKHCFRVFGFPGNTSSSCLYGFSNEWRRNRMFSFADLNRILNQA